MRTQFLAALVLLVGCVTPATAPVHTVSRARFDPSEKRNVWDRALEAFQVTNTLVAYSDANGGILRSERQPAWAPCSGSASGKSDPPPQCEANAAVQVTFSDGGIVIWRTNRMVFGSTRGYDDLVTEADERIIQKGQDDLLKWIATGTGTRPDAPASP